MPLLRLPEPFDHPDWLFEVKHDGFRALAHVDGHHCTLVSRNGHTFKHWPQLCEELAHAVTAHDAVIDGEIVCLDAPGRSNFKSLLFRREWPLVERKRRLRRLIPSVPTRLLYVDQVEARGRDFFEVACAHDLEGIVAKLASGRYHADGTTAITFPLRSPRMSPVLLHPIHYLLDHGVPRKSVGRLIHDPELVFSRRPQELEHWLLRQGWRVEKSRRPFSINTGIFTRGAKFTGSTSGNDGCK
jgi:hypothetical protein